MDHDHDRKGALTGWRGNIGTHIRPAILPWNSGIGDRVDAFCAYRKINGDRTRQKDYEPHHQAE
jgi:hypothetical protein